MLEQRSEGLVPALALTMAVLLRLRRTVGLEQRSEGLVPALALVLAVL